MLKSKNPSKGGAASFAETVAQFAIRDALRLTIRNAAQRFTAVLIAPDPSDCEIYEVAAEMHLAEFLAREFEEKKSFIATTAQKDILTSLQAHVHYEFHVQIAPVGELVTDEVRIAADRIGTIRRPLAEDFVEAVRIHFRSELSIEDAALLSTFPVTKISLAFTKGRRLSVAIRKLKVYDKGRFSLRTATPSRPSRDERTLHELPGYGAAKSWGLRLASDLVAWRDGRIDWQDVDKGLVLAGPPGVGKTVFARALAKTCDVTMIAASAAKWQGHGHLGDMLKAMSRSFAEAKDNAPAILFIDEIDSIPDREAARGDNADYERQVTNAFLEQLDGSNGRDGVVVVAATNRLKDLDKAILRPGRLERVIEIGLPDAEDRNSILRLNVPTLESGRSTHFDEATLGWSGADIEMLARDLLRVVRDQRSTPTLALLERMLPEPIVFDRDVRRRIAIHEAGHAIVGEAVADLRVHSMKVRKCVYPGDGRLVNGGETRFFEDTHPVRTRSWYEDRIAVAMAGIAAETLKFGEHADGAGNGDKSDLALANDHAKRMVVVFAMGKKWEWQLATDLGELKLGKREKREINRIIDMGYRRALRLIEREEAALSALADAVFDKMELGRKEIASILSEFIADWRDTPTGPEEDDT